MGQCLDCPAGLTPAPGAPAFDAFDCQRAIASADLAAGKRRVCMTMSVIKSAAPAEWSNSAVDLGKFEAETASRAVGAGKGRFLTWLSAMGVPSVPLAAVAGWWMKVEGAIPLAVVTAVLGTIVSAVAAAIPAWSSAGADHADRYAYWGHVALCPSEENPSNLDVLYEFLCEDDLLA